MALEWEQVAVPFARFPGASQVGLFESELSMNRRLLGPATSWMMVLVVLMMGHSLQQLYNQFLRSI
jgi:hypothetical protein